MKIAQINAVSYGSTGRIMFDLADTVIRRGGEAICTSGFTWKRTANKSWFMTSNIFEKTFHIHMAKLTGNNGSYSKLATARLIKRLSKFNPDIVHLHNIHGWFLNLPMFFDYVKKNDIRVIWTLHDCWAFTGHCPHFAMIGCDKWKSECENCPQYMEYPQCRFDDSKKLYHRKREWFTGVKNMTIITPSEWLAGLVKQSFLGEYPVEVINNGIDTEIFQPTESNFRKEYGCEEKIVLLGVAYDWNIKKGIDVFLDLAEQLDDRYRIVLVGTNDELDKRLPKNVISIHRTHDKREMAEIYTAADIFLNPTREDTYPTVNMEAICCGTPVITFNTGGSPEIVKDGCGIVVESEKVEELCSAIDLVLKSYSKFRESCQKTAEEFSNSRFLGKYIKLYEESI